MRKIKLLDQPLGDITIVEEHINETVTKLRKQGYEVLSVDNKPYTVQSNKVSIISTITYREHRE